MQAKQIGPVALAGALAVVVLGVSGCTAEVNRVESAHAIVDYEAQTIILPLTEYSLTDQESQTVAHANALIAEKCMARQGFPYPSAREIAWQREAHVTDRRYGIWNVDSAAKYGYEIPADDSRSPSMNPEPSTVTTDGFEQAFSFCFEDIQDDLIHEYLSYNADSSIADRGLFESEALAKMDSGWASARQSWTDCLSKSQITLAEPDGWVPVLPASKAAQIEIAIIDAQCKVDTNTVQRLADIEASYQAAFELEYQEQLHELKNAVRYSVIDAETLIGELE